MQVAFCLQLTWGHDGYLDAQSRKAGWPVLVLNSDFRPLSFYLRCPPGPWQDAIKAVFLTIASTSSSIDRAVHSPPSFAIQRPSVVSLKSSSSSRPRTRLHRFNVFLRDRFVFQYLPRA